MGAHSVVCVLAEYAAANTDEYIQGQLTSISTRLALSIFFERVFAQNVLRSHYRQCATFTSSRVTCTCDCIAPTNENLNDKKPNYAQCDVLIHVFLFTYSCLIAATTSSATYTRVVHGCRAENRNRKTRIFQQQQK